MGVYTSSVVGYGFPVEWSALREWLLASNLSEVTKDFERSGYDSREEWIDDCISTYEIFEYLEETYAISTITTGSCYDHKPDLKNFIVAKPRNRKEEGYWEVQDISPELLKEFDEELQEIRALLKITEPNRLHSGVYTKVERKMVGLQPSI